jgi:recombination protein RecA
MKIGVMFGSPETTTGGNALKFYASVRLDIRRTGTIKKGDEAIGNETKVKVVKNKVSPPSRRQSSTFCLAKASAAKARFWIWA